MPRTQEQKDADDALTEAILACSRAYYQPPESWVMSEYVVVACHQGYTDDGRDQTAIDTIIRDNNVPAHRVMGLLEAASTRLRANYVAGDDDE